MTHTVDTVGDRAVRRRRRLTTLAPYAAFLVLAFVLVGAVMHDVDYVSPTDEISHLDYLERFPEVPGSGARLGQDAMHEWACRGFAPGTESSFPPCDAERFEPEEFPGAGYSYSGSTPPLYYLVTAAVARPVAALTDATFFSAARWAGALWLAALMSVAYLLARRLGVAPFTAAAAAVLTSSAAAVVSSAGTLGPDVATGVAGGLMILAALAFDGSRRGLLLVLGAAAIAALTKLTTFPTVGAAMFVLVLGALPRGGTPGPWRLRTGVGAALATFGVFGIASAAWGVVYGSQEIVDPDLVPINAMFKADSVPWSLIWEEHLVPFLIPTMNTWEPATTLDVLNGNLEFIVAGLHVAALLVLVGAIGRDRRVGALGIGTLVLAVAGPFMLLLLNFYVNGLSFAIVSRYGYSLLAVYAAGVAWMCRDRGPSRAVAVLAALSVVNLLT